MSKHERFHGLREYRSGGQIIIDNASEGTSRDFCGEKKQIRLPIVRHHEKDLIDLHFVFDM